MPSFATRDSHGKLGVSSMKVDMIIDEFTLALNHPFQEIISSSLERPEARRFMMILEVIITEMLDIQK